MHMRWTSHRPLLVDTGIALAVLAVTLCFSLQYHPAGWPPFDGRAVAVTCLITLPLALRRVAEWPVLLVSSAALVVYVALGYQPSATLWPPLLAFLTIAAARPPRQVAVAAAVTGAVQYQYGVSSRAMSALLALAQAVLLVALAWGFGRTLHHLAERNRQLALLTARLRAHERALADQAVTEERLRIARELHDMVAHHLSVVSVQSGLARYLFDSDAARAREALTAIEETARQTLEDMRGLLRVLRVAPEDNDLTDGSSLESAAGLAHLDRLVARMTAAGLTVDLRVTGVPGELPQGPDLCAYRIIQEALTNILKHAGPGPRVWLTLAYRRDGLTGTITDDGGACDPPRPPRDTARPGPGHGLIGMNERVRLYGGQVRAGPRPPVGYQVEFTLPVPVRPVGDDHRHANRPRPR